MTDEQPPVHAYPAEHAAAPGTLAYEPIEADEDWLDEPAELPRRPRRRLLTPLPLTLLAVLLIACGFIGGVLVEKGQSSSSSSAAGGTGGLGARFAALRGGASAAGARTGAASAGGGGAGFFGGGAGGAGAGRTTGQVAYLAGSTLYVTNAEGDTVKVSTSAGTTVTKTVNSHVKSIHPGETVTILGAAGKNGAVSAESISVAPSTGSLVTLFGSR